MQLALNHIKSIAKPANEQSLRNIAHTALNSKMLKPHASYFVDILHRVLEIVPTLDLSRVRIVNIPGSELRQSNVFGGVMFPLTFSYAGAEQQAKSFSNPKILIINHEVCILLFHYGSLHYPQVEHKHQKEYAQAVIENPEDYDDFIKAEWELVYERLEKIIATGCNIVLNSQVSIILLLTFVLIEY